MKCKKCGSWKDDNGVCPKCSFVPKIGRLASGANPYRKGVNLTVDPMDQEDDYSEESGPDSVCDDTPRITGVWRNQGPRSERPKGRP